MKGPAYAYSEACRPDPRRERLEDVADALCPREVGTFAVELGQRGGGGIRRDQPAQRPQLPDGVRVSGEKRSFSAVPEKNSLVWEAVTAQPL